MEPPDVMAEPAISLVATHEEAATMRPGAHVTLSDVESRPDLEGSRATLESFAGSSGLWTVLCGEERLLVRESSAALVREGLIEVTLSLAGTALSGSMSVQRHEKTDVIHDAAQQLAATQFGARARAKLLCRGKPLARDRPVIELASPGGSVAVVVEPSLASAEDAAPETFELEAAQLVGLTGAEALVGRRVQACGLAGRADLNGRVGRVLSFEEAVGRFAVRFDAARGNKGGRRAAGGGAAEAESVRVKPENLRFSE